MKRSILIIALLLFSFSSFAQAKVRFGFTTSPGISWYSADSKFVDSKGTRFSFNYGAVFDFVIDNNERYAISSGVTIDMSGGKLSGVSSDNTNPGSSSLTAKVQYFEIPLSLKLRSNESANNLTFYGSLGIINSFRIRARGAYSYVDQNFPEDNFSDNNVRISNLEFFPSDINKINLYHLALHFEGGVEFRVSDNTSLVGGIYFRNGFTNVIKDTDNERVVARGLGLRIAVMF
ncbi:MAG TPA: outer membrane beta-barrel protein [Chitinophagales bacterium]|nr:outer membrane beta-barrel protein [Chitinophagales bacterium]